MSAKSDNFALCRSGLCIRFCFYCIKRCTILQITTKIPYNINGYNDNLYDDDDDDDDDDDNDDNADDDKTVSQHLHYK